MIFKELTYRQKQTGLILLTVIILVISWFSFFSRTYNLANECTELSQFQESTISNPTTFSFLNQKIRLQDSIISTLSDDSLTWTSNFLTQVGKLISSEETRVIFENKSFKSESGIVEREIILVGEFDALITALKQLEQNFYISSLLAFEVENELRYKLTLAILISK